MIRSSLICWYILLITSCKFAWPIACTIYLASSWISSRTIFSYPTTVIKALTTSRNIVPPSILILIPCVWWEFGGFSASRLVGTKYGEEIVWDLLNILRCARYKTKAGVSPPVGIRLEESPPSHQREESCTHSKYWHLGDQYWICCRLGIGHNRTLCEHHMMRGGWDY